MFFPWFVSKSENTPKVVSGEHYTAEWWQKKAGLDSKQKAVLRLCLLTRKGIVEKVSVGEYEIVRFMPTAMFCENDIVTMLKKCKLSRPCNKGLDKLS